MLNDRLSALDAAFLDLETERAPLHVGWTMRFDGRPPSLAALRALVGARLAALPRMRSRVGWPRLGLGDPHWVADERFDVARHVHELELAPGAGEQGLCELAGRLMATPLARDAPLWQLHLVRNVPAGRGPGFAVIGQIHHALVDGIAAVQIGMLLFDGLATIAPHAAAEELQRPSLGAGLADAASARLQAGSSTALALVRVVAGGPGAVRDLAGGVGAIAAPVPRTALDRSATRERRVAFESVPLAALQDAARRRGATLNDALLAATSGAVGAALARRGEQVDRVRALVPASTRTGGEHAGRHANRIAFLAIDLPVGEPDPARVLTLVRARTRARKLAGDAGTGDALLRAADLLPAPGRRPIARAAARAARFGLVVSNVRGPDVSLSLLGRQLTGVWPAVPLLDGHALSVGMLSYAGTLHLGLLGDAAVMPDTALLAHDLRAGLDQLCALPAPSVTPWRSRARERRDARLPAQRRASR